MEDCGKGLPDFLLFKLSKGTDSFNEQIHIAVLSRSSAGVGAEQVHTAQPKLFRNRLDLFLYFFHRHGDRPPI